MLGCVEASPLRGSVPASPLGCQAEAGRRTGLRLIVRDGHSALPAPAVSWRIGLLDRALGTSRARPDGGGSGQLAAAAGARQLFRAKQHTRQTQYGQVTTEVLYVSSRLRSERASARCLLLQLHRGTGRPRTGTIAHRTFRWAKTAATSRPGARQRTIRRGTSSCRHCISGTGEDRWRHWLGTLKRASAQSAGSAPNLAVSAVPSRRRRR